jgi:hypothetical protein
MLDERPAGTDTVEDDTDTVTEPAAEPKTRTLYDISTDYFEFEQLLESIDGDITPEDGTRIDAWLQNLDQERDKKLDAYGGLIKHLELRGANRTEEGKRISRLGEVDINKAKYLKRKLLGFFQFHVIVDAIQTLRFKFKKCANGGKLPLVFAIEATDSITQGLPEEFILRVPMPNNDLIREVLQAEDDPRRELIADVVWIGERGEHLRIS